MTSHISGSGLATAVVCAAIAVSALFANGREIVRSRGQPLASGIEMTENERREACLRKADLCFTGRLASVSFTAVRLLELDRYCLRGTDVWEFKAIPGHSYELFLRETDDGLALANGKHSVRDLAVPGYAFDKMVFLPADDGRAREDE